MDEDDLEHMKSKGDIDFVESSIENARAQVTNVEKVTRTLESLHNEMHDFEDRIFFLEHVQLCKMALRGAEINSVEPLRRRGGASERAATCRWPRRSSKS